jgi:predicted alpha/beta hydrolase family esterase
MQPNVQAKNYVVLLHGLGRSRRSLFGLQYWLRRAGYVVVNVGYPSRKIPVAEVVRDWLQPVLDTLDLRNGVRVHFVTHSLGGIVFRTWAAGRDPRFPLGQTVMLAPPNQGSEVLDYIGDHRWVRTLLGPAIDDLQTQALNSPRKLGPVPPGTGVIMGNQAKIRLFGHLFDGESDGIVPVAGGKVEGMAEFMVVPADHTFIMWRPVVLRAVERFLRHGVFDGHPPESALP